MKFGTLVRHRSRRLALLMLVSFAALPLGAEQKGSQRELVVCADRDNLPFSNEKAQGFENRIARLLRLE